MRIEKLAKRFGEVPVLRDVDLEVPEGCLLAILGASGSGKTTLLRLVCGFERADGGTIAIGGHPVSGPGLHVRPERRHVGYVAQDGALFPHLSVAENVTFGLRRSERRHGRRVDQLLEMVGLPPAYATRPPQALSGGEQQRVALARALAPEPELILLDEPFSALDAALRLETRQVVAAALARAGATALLVTHDQSEALSMGDRVAVLRHGRLVQMDTPMQLYRQPVDADLARFVGEAVLLPGMARNGAVVCGLGRLMLMSDAPAEGAVTVLIRPEQIRLVPATLPAPGLHARVGKVAYFGHDASVELDLLDQKLVVTARVPGHLAPQGGQVVGLSIEGAVATFPPTAIESDLQKTPLGSKLNADDQSGKNHDAIA